MGKVSQTTIGHRQKALLPTAMHGSSMDKALELMKRKKIILTRFAPSLSFDVKSGAFAPLFYLFLSQVQSLWHLWSSWQWQSSPQVQSLPQWQPSLHWWFSSQVQLSPQVQFGFLHFGFLQLIFFSFINLVLGSNLVF